MKRQGAGLDRVQTGVRLDKQLVKVLKAMAELQDLSLGDLLEAMALQCLAGQVAFDEGRLVKARELMAVYGLRLDAQSQEDGAAGEAESRP
jgi:hypothetical protein